MRKWLLLISLCCCSVFAYCQDTTGRAKHVVSKKAGPHHAKRHTIKKQSAPGEVIHGAQDQDKLDSMKAAKLRNRH